MTYVRSFVGYQPPARYDGSPFVSARIQESADDVAWTTLETITLSPVDADPENPATRDLTTTLATLETGYYRIVWVDGDGFEYRTDSVLYPGDESSYQPNVADIGALLRARTRTVDTGQELGTFTTGTRPTAAQVEILIGMATDQVAALVSTDPAVLGSDALSATVRQAIALRAALLVEMSYFPEQIADGASPFLQLRELSDAATTAAVALLSDDLPGGLAFASIPIRSSLYDDGLPLP